MATGDGSDVMMIGARAATSEHDLAAAPPILVKALTAEGAMSKPMTSKPAASRWRAKAPPMIPRPIWPTRPLLRLLFFGLLDRIINPVLFAGWNANILIHAEQLFADARRDR